MSALNHSRIRSNNNKKKDNTAKIGMDSDTDEWDSGSPNPYTPGSLFALYTQKTGIFDKSAEDTDETTGGAGDPDRVTGNQIQGFALEGLTSTETECAEGSCTRHGAPCSSKPVLTAIASFSQHIQKKNPVAQTVKSAEGSSQGPMPHEMHETKGREPKTAPPDPLGVLPKETTPEAAAVRKAAEAVGCGSESCLLAHPHFVNYAEEVFGLEPERLQREKDLRFKAAGPRLGHALLNNFNIDETLQRWARVFTNFFPYPFAMMDFDRTGEPFATIDPVAVLAGQVPVDLGPGLEKMRRPCQTLGCVVNTDVSTGKGKHWVAVFVDCRGSGEWTVEYFNSAGRPPPKVMTHWMERTRARLAAARKSSKSDSAVRTTAVTDVAHQESQTECGLYALFYIRRRLEGTPAAYFEDPTKIITDDEMTEFRKHCFRAAT